MTCTCDHTISASTPALTVCQLGVGKGASISCTQYDANALEIQSSTTSQSAIWANTGQGTGYCIVASCSTGRPSVLGQSTGSSNNGVQGTSTGGTGVYGYSSAQFGYGVQGLATGTSGCGVYGSSQYSWAGYFSGATYVGGYLTKAGGGYQVDHPTDPENKILNHCFVESPEMLNQYSDTAIVGNDGTVEVSMPSYFSSATEKSRIQLTAQGCPMPNLHVSKKMSQGKFTIGGGVSGMEVVWTVVAARADKWAKANHPGVEIDKKPEDKGLFMHPELHGHDHTKNMNRKVHNPEIIVDFVAKP